MPITVNTNVASLQAQNSLTQVNKALQQNQTRLSTGLRINSAADDAAGLAISTRMSASIRGMNQAVSNSNDGISMMQTAEGALDESTNILQRMRELAVQSSNETNTASDREDLNQEYQNQLAELDRIANVTDFNGRKLLDGSLGEAQFQVGPDTAAPNKISIDISASMQSKDIGGTKEFGGNLDMQNGTGGGSLGTGGGSVQISQPSLDNAQELGVSNYAEVKDDGTSAFGTGDSQTATGKTTTSAYAMAKAINDNGQLSVDASAENSQTGVNPSLTVQQEVSGGGQGTAKGTYNLDINGVSIFDNYEVTATANPDAGETEIATAKLGAETVVGAINAKQETIGVTAQTTEAGNVKLNNLEGGNILVGEEASGGLAEGTGGNASAMFIDGKDDLDSAGGASNIFRGEVSLVSNESIEVSHITGGGGDVFEELGAGGTVNFSAPDQQGFLNSTDITSVSNSQTAIDRIDQAINDMNGFRATLGATQNRLEATVTNLNNAVENTTAARSRIQDADIAKESAEMTQNNIRRQAASSILAQANQNPQIALQLLGG